MTFKSLAPTIIGVVLVLFFFGPPRGGAIILPIFLIPIGGRIAFRYINAPRKSLSQRLNLIRAIIWFAATVIVASAHTYYFLASRDDAQRVADKALTYYQERGVYPPSVEELGEDGEKLKRKWMLYYHARNGKPYLIYGTTFIPFETYGFDFSSLKWVYFPD